MTADRTDGARDAARGGAADAPGGVGPDADEGSPRARHTGDPGGDGNGASSVGTADPGAGSDGGGSGHREIEHTADLGFEVWAADLGALYAEAVLAIAELCYDRAAVAPAEQRQLRVSGASPEERMVHWLQEVYLWLEMDGWLTADAIDVHCERQEIAGMLRGEPYDPERHTLHTEIKAITYHEMEIRRDDGTWRTVVIVDV